MRLIDADALKKAFKRSPFVNEVHLYYARQLIRLAPTIEINTNDIEYKAYCKGLDDGRAIARQRGEWIDTGYGTWRCSVCGEKCQTYCMDKPRDRYCLWCGALMRKGGDSE